MFKKQADPAGKKALQTNPEVEGVEHTPDAHCEPRLQAVPAVNPPSHTLPDPDGAGVSQLSEEQNMPYVQGFPGGISVSYYKDNAITKVKTTNNCLLDI